MWPPPSATRCFTRPWTHWTPPGGAGRADSRPGMRYDMSAGRRCMRCCRRGPDILNGWDDTDMKKQILSFTALLLALLLAGCAASALAERQRGFVLQLPRPAHSRKARRPAARMRGPSRSPTTLGRTVTVESPKRVAALIGSFADVWCLAGGKDTLVAAADDTWTQFDLGLPETVVNLGGVKRTECRGAAGGAAGFCHRQRKDGGGRGPAAHAGTGGHPHGIF